MEVNTEYKSLAKYTINLSNYNFMTVSGWLMEKGLVTKDVYDSKEGISSQKNAGWMISCVLDWVKLMLKQVIYCMVLCTKKLNCFEDILVKILEVHGKARWRPRKEGCPGG